MQPLGSLKRKRVELACTTCRNRKSKCDGQRPFCSSCKRAGIECRFEQVLHTSNSRTPRARRIGSECSIEPESSPFLSSSRGDANSTSDLTQVDEEAAVDNLSTDAFGDDSAHDRGYFGPSSNHAHFRSLSTAFAQMARSRNTSSQFQLDIWTQNQNSLPPLNDQGSIPYAAFDPHEFPDERNAISLFDRFFTTINLVLPFLNRFTLLQEYRKAKQVPPDRVRPSLRILFNVIWAHASSSLNRPEAEVFYRRAVTLLDSLSIRRTGLELLQIFLLLTIFQQNHQRSVASWTFLALSVKSALQLGLHSPSSYQAYNSEEKELRKCIWFGVVIEDRILSISLGRPCLLPEQHNRIEQLQDPKWSSFAISPDQEDSITFFRHKISISSIIHGALENLYDHNICAESLTLEDLIVGRSQLHLQLGKWLKSASPFQVITARDLVDKETTHYDAKRFQILLSIYYYRLNLLINRPVISKFLNDYVHTDAESLPDHIQESIPTIINSDVRAAIALQGLINTICKHDPGFLHRYAAWWAANYSIFSTSLHLFGVLLVSLRFPALQAGIDRVEIRHALEEGLETLSVVGKTSLISWKGRNCLSKYLEGYDVLAQELPASNASSIPLETPHMAEILPISTNTGSRDASLEQSLGSMSDFITRAAEDFFSQCTEVDLLQDDHGAFLY